MHKLMVGFALVFGVMPSHANTLTILDQLSKPTVTAPMTPMPAKPIRLAQSCGKQCSKGKACGNSCISRDKQCHKGKGCACD